MIAKEGRSSVKVFSIVGVSKSGKTTVAEAVIAELRRRNYRVGSVKDIHFEGFAMDREGTNTHRHKMAGAELVTARGLYETDFLFPSRLGLSEILRFYDQDFVILEGAYDFKGPGLIAACTEAEIDERRWDNAIAVTGRIADRLKEYRGLPVINALTDAAGLTDLIEKTVMPWHEQAEWIGRDNQHG
jgi:molybdopterin-guanine dinucleotide biosynthesis protein B